MTETVNKESETTTPPQKETKKGLKSGFGFVKIFLIIIAGICGFIYFKNLKIHRQTEAPKTIKNAEIKNQNHEIFEISDEEKYNTTLHDINISEIKEKGAEFVYQLLIKNQNQIEELNTQIKDFKSDLVKIKNQEKFSHLVLDYVILRDKLFNGEDCKNEVESYELLTMSDNFLRDKFTIIKNNYKNIQTQKQLTESFLEITKQLIINKNFDEKNATFIEKIRHNFKKLVIIRKTNNVAPNDIEAIIIETQQLISKYQYSDASKKLLILDKLYSPIVQKFIEDLNIASEIQNADSEIIKYFKSLT